MKTKLILFTSLLALAAHPLRAETNVETVVFEAVSNQKNAVAIFGWAVMEDPSSAPQLVAAAFTALPEKAVEILRAALKAAPGQAVAIVRAAIQAKPERALELASFALATLPAQAREIVTAAAEAAPESARAQIAALTPPEEARASRNSRPAARQFPAQPVRPDVVSPSGDASTSRGSRSTVTPPVSR